ncbi:MAG: hypothetical protein M0000_08735 [Actinomycetota bacterium]|nr:hypothetical protein [Actinomycetota bacterium]
MDLEEWLKPTAELNGVCRLCETPYLNAADDDGVLIEADLPEGERLPGHNPVRLAVDEDDWHGFVLGEWCSPECFWNDVSALAKRLNPTVGHDTPHSVQQTLDAPHAPTPEPSTNEQ